MFRPSLFPVTQGSADRVRGTVAVTRDAAPRVVLEPADGGARIRVDARDLCPIARVDGAGVVAYGTLDPTGRSLWLDRFVVVSMRGVPAVDGLLTAEGERITLVTEDGGELLIPDAPAGLREHVGARVWVAGEDLGEGLEAFGLIEKPG